MNRILLRLSLLLLLGAAPLSAAPSVGNYLVNHNGNAADAVPGDGVCATAGGVCTLHAAIEEANLDGDTSYITFSMPMEISYATLPPLTESATFIDGRSVWNGTWPGGRPGVRITAGNSGRAILDVQADSAHIYGIEFVSCGPPVFVGIYIDDGSSHAIGGQMEGQRNVFLCGTGVEVATAGSNVSIFGNYFGTWDGENMVPSTLGVHVLAGSTFVEENLIVGHGWAGILLQSQVRSLVRANTIGADRLRSGALPNTVGIQMDAARNHLVEGNFIGGNGSEGIELRRSDGNTITGNTIGDPPPRGGSLGNGSDGIRLFDADDNMVTANVILDNGGNGVSVEGDGNVVTANTIGGNSLDGVRVDGAADNLIGGAAAGEGNRIEENGANGVHLAGNTATANRVQGNAIGGDIFAAGNLGHGVLLTGGAYGNRIGGLGEGEGNFVNYNQQSGIYLTGADTRENVVEGNVVGAARNWVWPAGNGHHGIGVYGGAHDNFIGWNNWIVSNSWSGVAVVNSVDNIVLGNNIGLNPKGADWGNGYYGVHVVNGAGNVTIANDIGFNGQEGVQVDGGAGGNPISVNAIHDNDGAGITLQNGGNASLAAPTVSAASCPATPGAAGMVTGTACPGCKVEIFSDMADEGGVFEGTATADGASGAFAWSGRLHGPYVTATSTDQQLNTSPFSAPAESGRCLLPRQFLPAVIR